MCKYKYKEDYKRQRKEIGKRCRNSELFKRVLLPASNEQSTSLELPIDEHGLCIFHSADLQWKLDNNFKQYFLKLISITEKFKDLGCYDFAEFIFVGSDNFMKAGKELPCLNLYQLTFHKPTCFFGSVFKHATDFDQVNFEHGAGFEKVTFCSDLTVKNNKIKGADFRSVQFDGRAMFSANEYISYSMFSASRFSGKDPGYVAKFEDSTFHEIADF